MTIGTSERATAGALVVLGAFQTGLALGAGWGRAAYGGSHPGVLPGHLRGVSAAAAAVYGGAAALVVRGSGTPRTRRRAYTALSVLMGVGTIANGVSRSPVERAVWTPITAATAAIAWRSRTARA